MMTYFNRPVTEATLQEMDCGRTFTETGHESLATIAKRPGVIVAVNHARQVADKDRWQALCRGNWNPTPDELVACRAILAEMPGYACLDDAANIAARL